MMLTQREVDSCLQEGRLSSWAAQAYAEFCRKVSDTAFPCTFGTIALKKRKVRFVFIESTTASARLDALVHALTDYALFVETTPLVTAVMQPLAILMPPPPGWQSLEDYYYNSWHLLEAINRRDPHPWPTRIPTEPDSQGWSFCFGGVPLFVNFKTPIHNRRRSRRLRQSYLWLVQAREGFDQVAGDTRPGREARRVIREKLEAYDSVPIYPYLGYSGQPGSRDWKEYFLPETNEPFTTVCPFSADVEKPDNP